MRSSSPFKTVALTMGTFDPVHVDHVMLFRRCLEFATQLIVGVNSDRFCKEYRGRSALFTEDERIAQVKVLGYEALLNDGPGVDLLHRIGPDFLVVGNDWLARDYLDQIKATPEDFEETGLVFLPRGKTISSTDIRTRA